MDKSWKLLRRNEARNGALEEAEGSEATSIDGSVVNYVSYGFLLSWNRGHALTNLITVAFTFDCLSQQIAHTLRGLWLFAPNIERFTLEFKRPYPFLNWEEDDNKLLHKVLLPVKNSQVKHLSLFVHAGALRALKIYGDWYQNLQSLTTEDIYSWKWNFLNENLKCLHVINSSLQNFLMPQIANLVQVQFSCYISTSRDDTCNWLYYYVCRFPVKWIYFKDDFFHAMDLACEEAKLDLEYSNFGAWFGYYQLRQKFKNMVACNRHFYRRRILLVLSQAASNANAKILDSTRDICSLLYPLLDL